MWFLLLLHIAHIQPAISQDAEKRLVLRNGSNPCEGHVEVFYNNKSGLVGDKFWSRETEEVVCRSTHCGTPVGNASENVRRPLNRKVWLNELQCNGSQKQLWDCDSPGWGISYYQKPIVKKITCSRNITFSLEGSRCAGAVRYSDGGKLAGYICNDNWGDDEARHLCEQLECGGLKKRPTPGQMSAEAFQKLSGNMKLNCRGMNRMDNLWQCAAPDSSCQYPAAVICSDHESLRLTERCSGKLQRETNGKWEDVNDNNVSPDVRCQQMHCGGARGNVTDSKLTCTDDVKVVLVNSNNERCYGTVHAEINGTRKAVCGSSWKKQADVVCKELGCGTVNSVSTRSSSPGIMDFVECSGSESSLWHCEAKHGENLPCPRAPYVVCSASLKVRLKDGGGRCAGRLEVKHEGQWKRVLQNQAWTNQHSNIVCKQLKCGTGVVPGNPVKYNQGSGSFLTVDCKSDINKKQKISECIITDSGNNGQSAVGITCEDHKVLFLSGSCSGEVGIKHGSKTFWLSNVDWNQDVANTVCQQMHCGNAVNVNSTSRADKMEVWSQSYNCSRNETSLFECDNTTFPSDVNQNASIASVTCSGEIHLKLTKRCWGNVNISMEGKSGSICADTWTEDNSRMLCEEQGCENKVLKSLSPSPRQAEIMVLSLHVMQPTANLSQYNFIMKQDNDRTCQKPASVVCSGSIEPRFSVSRDSCSGSLELLYEESWLPVCTEALSNADTRNTICRTLNCGQAIENSLDFGPTPASRQVITQIQCSTNATSLKECDVTSETRSCTLGVLKCSGWKAMVLEHNEPCKGEVVIYSAGKVSAVSSEGWTKNESQRLCQDMTCGSPISLEEKVPWPTDSVFNGSFSCAGKPQSIWECEKKVQPVEKKKLFIECQNEAQVTLSQKCHGELRINNTQVCNSQWKLDYSNRVCQELSCSNAMDFTEEGKPRPEGMYHHIHCDEYHFKLGQCRRVRGSCNSASLVEIVCVGSIKFNTTGKCGGNIQVSYRDKWKEVCIQNELTTAMKHQLCQKMNCGNHNSSIKPRNTSEKKLEMRLVCTDNHLDIKHCVKKQTCQGVPAEIYCQGYEPPIIITEDEPSRVPLILGVSFLLVLLVVVAVGARFYFTRRNRKLNPARMLPGKEMEFESGEYEDVVNRDDEMEDVRGGRFRSDAEFFREDNRRSASSLPYDDIDEAIEAQPLNPPANTTRDSNMQEDKVSYEVEDPPENYDDIDDITKAEVHDGPKPTADRDAAAAPPGPAPGGEDYLVPGRDG